MAISPRTGAAALVLLLAVALPPHALSAAGGVPSGVRVNVSDGHCLDCHGGIEGINDLMDQRWQAHTDCTACHKGNAGGATMEDAHDGLIAKPGDLRVVTNTCGTCHARAGIGVGLTTGPAKDVVDRVLRSPMALATGEIAAVRYLWGEQSTPEARYGVRSVASLHAETPPGAVSAVAELPHARNSPADHLLRARCLQCHLWTEPAPGLPPYRGAGCAACHVAYAADGRSRSGDPTVSKTEPGHPVAHRITRYVANAQCLTCHRDEGLGIGWNFTGWLPRRDGDMGATTPTAATALPVTPDVHAAAGMACIDCHDTYDVHGDGHVYARGRAAVGIRCISCHGTATTPPTFTTTRGHPLANVEQQEGGAVLVGKVSQREWRIPRLDRMDGDRDVAAHRIAGHAVSAGDPPDVSCVACHAGIVGQRFLRRFELDDRQAVPYDWAEGVTGDGSDRVTPGRWTVRSIWNPVGLPMVGINAAGTADPLVASFHTLRTLVDATGRELESGRLLHTQDGRYGAGFRTLDPHRTQRVGRSCDSCHSDPAALGLGSRQVDAGRLGWPLRYAPDQVADAEGTAIMAFSTPGERPLNHGELVRTLRRSACLECHVDRPTTDVLPATHSPVEADRAHRRRLATPGDTPEPHGASAVRSPASETPRRPKSATGDVAPGRNTGSAVSAHAPATQPAQPTKRTEAQPPELSPFVGR